jgi:protein FLOWERING LOCUS T
MISAQHAAASCADRSSLSLAHSFPAPTPCQVIYGDVLVSGQMLDKDQTSKAPHIAAPSASEMHLYTVIMYDPDAPSPSAPICKNWLHWIYTDAVGKHLTGGKQFVKYNGPTPPDGVHTYHIALYSQAAELMNAEPPSARCKFSPSEFAEQNGLTFIAEQTFKVAAGGAA